MYTYLHSIIQLFLLLTIIFKNCILIVVFLKCYISMQNISRNYKSVRSHFRNRYRYLIFYWKTWFYIWYMAFAWWLVPCLPFPGLQYDLEFFMFAVMKTFVTDISSSTGRNDFIFDIWLLHGELYCVSPFQVYRTSTFCLPCDLCTDS